MNWFLCCKDLDQVSERFDILTNLNLPDHWVTEIIDQFNLIMNRNRI